MIFGKRGQAGLDIGTDSLTWAACDRGGKSCQVRREELFPERGSKDDVLTGEPLHRRVKALLAKIARSTTLWSRQVVVGIQGEDTVSGYVELPELSADELDMAVLSSVSREVPFSLENLKVVHLPVPSLTPGTQGVFYSAWKRASAQRLVELCTSHDLTVRRFEASGIALTRELFRNHPLQVGSFYGLVNIGFEFTQLVFARAGYPYFIRDLPLGGRNITHALQVVMGEPWAAAEERKRETSVYQLIDNMGLGPVLGEFSYEIGRTVAYFCHRFKVDGVEALYLSGGGSLLAQLPEWLEEEVRVPVRRESWQQVRVDGEGAEPALHKVAVGLALGQQ